MRCWWASTHSVDIPGTPCIWQLQLLTILVIVNVSDSNAQSCIHLQWICVICWCSVGSNEPPFTWFISVRSLSPARLLAQQSFRWLVTMYNRRGWCCVWRPTTKELWWPRPLFKLWAWPSRYHLISADSRNPLLLALPDSVASSSHTG